MKYGLITQADFMLVERPTQGCQSKHDINLEGLDALFCTYSLIMGTWRINCIIKMRG